MALIDNVIGYWKLDETSGTDAEDEVSTNNLTLTDSAAFGSGKLNNGVVFDGGTNDQKATGTAYTEIADDADYSVSFWVNFTSLTNNDACVGNWNDGNDILSVMIQSSKLIATHYDGDQDSAKQTTDAVSTATWYHVVIVHTGSTNLVELYLDTVLQDNGGGGVNFLGDSRFILGNFRAAGFAPMDGIIDEVGVWSRKLTSDERSDLYNSGEGFSHPFPVAPVAAFSGAPTEGPDTLSVTFTDASTNVPTSWLWDFGDGSSKSTSQNPSHTYVRGVYTVRLTVTNVKGSDDEIKTEYINVSSDVTRGIGTAEIARRYPVDDGIIARTTTQEGHIMNLVPEKSLVPDREKVGL